MKSERDSEIFEKVRRDEAVELFGELFDIMERLRSECPWDREQTLESLRPLTIEESYELNEALLEGDLTALSKELGDLLLHILFYSKIGQEKGRFDMAHVIEQLNERLKYRHPHIFGEIAVASSEDVEKNWELLKTKERGGNKTLLSGVPSSLPSLIKAYRMQDKARGVGFDWAEPSLVWEKVKEEIGEFEEQLESALAKGEIVEGSAEALEVEKELGDLFFSLVNVARLYNLNPDNALEGTNSKFKRRLGFVEKRVMESGEGWSAFTPEQLEMFWEEAKNNGE